MRYGRSGKLRSVGVSLDTLWFGRYGELSWVSFRLVVAGGVRSGSYGNFGYGKVRQAW